MISFFIGAASAVTASLGFGSGCVMLICLSMQGIDRLAASGINLLFFPITGAFSLLLHHRRGLVCWHTALPLMLWGCTGALLGCWAADLFPSQWLSRLFGGLLLILGLRELSACLQKNRSLHNRGPTGAE